MGLTTGVTGDMFNTSDTSDTGKTGDWDDRVTGMTRVTGDIWSMEEKKAKEEI